MNSDEFIYLYLIKTGVLILMCLSLWILTAIYLFKAILPSLKASNHLNELPKYNPQGELGKEFKKGEGMSRRRKFSLLAIGLLVGALALGAYYNFIYYTFIYLPECTPALYAPQPSSTIWKQG